MKRTIKEVIKLIREKAISVNLDINKIYNTNIEPLDKLEKMAKLQGKQQAYLDILSLLESSHLVEQEKEYKDIEKDIGLQLNVLFEALKNEGTDNTGIYAIHPETKELCFIPLPELYYSCHQWNIGCRSTNYNIKNKECDSWDCKPSDYKKTWWLKEDKSE